MIACPTCGQPTAVVETRALAGAARRRRKCTDAVCPGRVTPYEIVVDRSQDMRDAVLVPRRVIERLQRAVAALGGAA